MTSPDPMTAAQAISQNLVKHSAGPEEAFFAARALPNKESYDGGGASELLNKESLQQSKASSIKIT